MSATIHIQHLLGLTYKMYMWDLPCRLEELEYKTDYYEGYIHMDSYIYAPLYILTQFGELYFYSIQNVCSADCLRNKSDHPSTFMGVHHMLRESGLKIHGTNLTMIAEPKG
jgi:hypothetical protein